MTGAGDMTGASPVTTIDELLVPAGVDRNAFQPPRFQYFGSKPVNNGELVCSGATTSSAHGTSHADKDTLPLPYFVLHPI
jgi:hypothetical protein